MAKFGLLTIPIFILGIGLAACSGGGTPTAGTGSGSGEPAEPPSEALEAAEREQADARTRLQAAEQRLQNAQTSAERADAMLLRDAAQADVTSLTAKVNLERARAAVQGAEALAQGATTPEERSAALARLQAAEAQLSATVEVAERGLREAEAALAADGADAASAEAMTAASRALGRATRILVQARAFRISASTQIATAKQLVAETEVLDPDAPSSLTVRLGPVAGAPGTAPYDGRATIDRFPRANSDGTELAEADRLKIQQDAVPYSDGKRVISVDSPGSTDELPLRQVTVRIGTTTAGDVKIQGQDGTGETYSNTDGVPVSSIQMDENRIVYKYGGEGVAFHDLQRRFDIGSSIDAWENVGADLLPSTSDDGNCWQQDLAKCTAWNFDDLSVTWIGTPGTDPGGERSHYWNSRVPLREGQSAQHSNLLTYFQKGRTLWDLGLYELWVTNYGGVDRQLEYPKGRRYAEDDVEQFLSYAAYGMFVHTDTLADLSTAALPSRMQGFHFGYDAFEDAEGRKTTDISSPVNLSFQGKTMALMYQHFENKNPLRVDLRADIVLNARIGGSGANTISGEFLKFEQLAPEGVWVSWDEAIRIRQTGENDPDKHQRLVMAGRNYKSTGRTWEQDYSRYGATINADGSYEGGIFYQYWDGGRSRWTTHSWTFDSSAGWTACSNGCYDDYPTSFGDASPATFSGTLYGPRDNLNELETAGYWYLPGDTREKRWGGIVGSFGAVQIPSE